MGTERPKQYLPLAGRPVLEHVLQRFAACAGIDGLMVVLAADDGDWPSLAPSLRRPLWTTTGADERCRSVLAGLRALEEIAVPDDWVLVHDAARPCLHPEDLQRLLVELRDDPVGGLLATPVRDTMKRAGPDGRISATEDRTGLWHAQTPQMFRYALLCEALASCLDRGVLVTDEAAAVEALGHAPRLIPARHPNIKLTTPEDLAYVEYCVQRLPAG